MTKTDQTFFLIFLVAPLTLILIALIESQIFLHIYGAGNIPTWPFLTTIAITCFVYRKCLSRFFDWVEARNNG